MTAISTPREDADRQCQQPSQDRATNAELHLSALEPEFLARLAQSRASRLAMSPIRWRLQRLLYQASLALAEMADRLETEPFP
jgi:hypothetical protein